MCEKLISETDAINGKWVLQRSLMDGGNIVERRLTSILSLALYCEKIATLFSLPPFRDSFSTSKMKE